MDPLTLNLIWRYSAWFFFIVVCVWAFVRGGPTEKIGAAIIIVCWLAWVLLNRLDGPGPGIVTIAIDVASFIAYAWLTIQSRRLWVFFTTACVVNTLITHFIVRSERFGGYSYITILDMWGSYGPLICLAFGIIGYQRMRKRQLALAGSDQASTA